MYCVNMSPPLAILTHKAVGYAGERTCPASDLGKPVTDIANPTKECSVFVFLQLSASETSSKCYSNSVVFNFYSRYWRPETSSA